MAEKTLAELLAEARTQIKSSGDDEGPMAKLAKEIEAALARQDSTTEILKRLSTLEDKDTKGAAVQDQIVDGQLSIRHRASSKAGYSQLDNAEIYQRMIHPDGLTMQQKLTMSENQLKKYVAPELMDRIRIYKELNDDALLLGWVLATIKGATITDGEIGTQIVREALLDTRTWKALQSVSKALTTSVNTAGSEWMPTQFSSNLVDIITVSLKISANFDRINIPTNTFKVPISTSDDIAFLVSENTSDNLLQESLVYPKFTPGTSNVSFNAKKLAGIIVFSEEAQEDSVIPLIPFLIMKIGRAMANAQERATLDGDVTTTHQDSDVTSPLDARKAWRGMRKTALSGSLTSDLSTFNLDNVRNLRGKIAAAFAENPENLFYATSVSVMLRMLKFPEFLTIDKYGALATIVKGEVGRIDGSPVQTSKYSRDDMNAVGVFDNVTKTKSLLYLQNNMQWWYGDRREIRIDSAKMVISGQGYLVVSQRLDFKDIYPSATYNAGAIGYNI